MGGNSYTNKRAINARMKGNAMIQGSSRPRSSFSNQRNQNPEGLQVSSLSAFPFFFFFPAMPCSIVKFGDRGAVHKARRETDGSTEFSPGDNPAVPYG